MVAAAVIGGSVASAGIGAMGASSAAGKQAGAAAQSAQLQAQEMNQNIAFTEPYINAGQIGAQNLQGALLGGTLGAPMDISGIPSPGQVPQFTGQLPQWTQGTPPQWTGGEAPGFQWNPTQAGLEATPGYQFTLQQGLQAVQNSAAAQGLGTSGTALAGAAQYATGLANQTYNQQLQNAESVYQNQLAGFGANVGLYGQQLQGYGQGTAAYLAQTQGFGQAVNAYGQQLAGFGQQAGAFQNQFNDYWANQTNRYNQLAGLAGIGAQTAVGGGSNLANQSGNVGNALVAQGAANAAGTMGVSNALSSGIGNISNAYLMNNLTGGSLFNPGAGGGYVDSGTF